MLCMGGRWSGECVLGIVVFKTQEPRRHATGYSNRTSDCGFMHDSNKGHREHRCNYSIVSLAYIFLTLLSFVRLRYTL